MVLRVTMIVLFWGVLAAEAVLLPSLMHQRLEDYRVTNDYEYYAAAGNMPRKYKGMCFVMKEHNICAEMTVTLAVLLVPGLLLEILKQWYPRRSSMIKAGTNGIYAIGTLAFLLSPMFTRTVQDYLLS